MTHSSTAPYCFGTASESSVFNFMGVDSLFKEIWNGVARSASSPTRKGPASPQAPDLAMSTTTSDSSSSSNSSDAEIDTEPSIELKPPTEANDAEVSQHSDPSVNIDRLPDDHPVHLLEEARKTYGNQRPPFALKKRSEMTRRCVIPTKDGLRPKFPTMVQIFAKHWDEKFVFWTVDINKTRYIVKTFSGQNVGGAKYLPWAGPGKNFLEKPLALSEFSSGQPRPKAPTEDSSSEDEDKVISHQSNRRRRRTTTTDTSFYENEDRPSDEDSPVPPASIHPIEKDADTDLVNRQARPKNALKKGKRPTRHSELPPRIALHQISADEDRRKRRKTDSSTGEISYLEKNVSFPCHDGSAAVALETQKPRRPEQPQASSSTSFFTNLFAPQPPPNPSVLAPHKIQRTTLIVRVVSFSEYQPYKMNGSTNLSTFYEEILGVWGLTEDQVAKVTVTFPWVDVEDVMRTMIFKPTREANFVHLLERIDDAPCWEEERGKCFLDVAITLVE